MKKIFKCKTAASYVGLSILLNIIIIHNYVVYEYIHTYLGSEKKTFFSKQKTFPIWSYVHLCWSQDNYPPNH